MVAKPATVPLFDTNSTLMTATTAGHVSDGFVANEIPSGSEFSYLFHWLGQWAAYLNNPDILTLQDLTTTGAMLTTGVTTVALAAGANNNVALGAHAAVLVATSAFTSSTITGITGGVDGREITIVVPSGSPWTLNSEDGASTAANRIQIGTDGVAAYNLYVLLFGAVRLRYIGSISRWVVVGHSPNVKKMETLLLSGLSFVPLTGNTIVYAAGTTFAQGINMGASIPILSGKVILEIRAEIQDVAGSTMTIALERVDGYASGAQIAISSASSGAGTPQTLTITGLSTLTLTGSSYALAVVRASGGGTDLNISRVEIDYIH